MTALRTSDTQRTLAREIVAELVHDAEVASILEEANAKLSTMLAEAHTENRALVLLLREFVRCAGLPAWAQPIASLRARAIDLLEKKYAEGTKP